MEKLPDINKSMTMVIAQRALELELNGKIQKLLLKIGQPIQDVQTASGLDWRCPIMISGLSDEVYNACGLDSIQALGLAFSKAFNLLAEFEEQYQAKIRWLGGSGHGLANFS